jgi:CBS domain-containing protein
VEARRVGGAWPPNRPSCLPPAPPALPRLTPNATRPPQTARGFTSACVTDSGEVGGRLLGIVTTRDIDFVTDKMTPLSEIMTT